jgi:hypothetical protein|tara:strand:+ start:435 stop:581 length:147 start_codon:yes stop_codon:yes gene_type:complete
VLCRHQNKDLKKGKTEGEQKKYAHPILSGSAEPQQASPEKLLGKVPED